MLAETDTAMLNVIDTQGTPAGAARAARAALKAGAPVILGPLSAAEAQAVAGSAAGRVPVVAFTNDGTVRVPGTFVFGITASQATSAILGYARSRGVRRVLVVGDGSPWSSASIAAAMVAQGELGLSVETVTLAAGGALPAIPTPPDAVFVPGGSATVLAAARNLRESGVQLLATVQGLDHRPDAIAALEGAWIASPDPDRFGTFAAAFTARNGGRPGAIAALAFDAANIARTLRQSDALTREGLLSEKGFDCVTGAVRFRSDGSCARNFAILVPATGGYDKVAESRGA